MLFFSLEQQSINKPQDKTIKHYRHHDLFSFLHYWGYLCKAAHRKQLDSMGCLLLKRFNFECVIVKTTFLYFHFIYFSLFIYSFGVVYLFFVCLRHVCCMSNISGLSVLNWPFSFCWRSFVLKKLFPHSTKIIDVFQTSHKYRIY